MGGRAACVPDIGICQSIVNSSGAGNCAQLKERLDNTLVGGRKARRLARQARLHQNFTERGDVPRIDPHNSAAREGPDAVICTLDADDLNSWVLALPDDILALILAKLRPDDVWRAALACRRFRSVASWIVRSWHLHQGCPSALLATEFFPGVQELSSRGTLSDHDVIANLPKAKSLESLDVSYCYCLTDAGLEALAKSAPGLRTLSLMWLTNITDKGLRALPALGQLSTLSISDCYYITDEGLKAVATMTQLVHLDVVFCDHISDEGLRHMRALVQLEALNIEGCDEVTDDGIWQAAQLPKLRVLNASCCRQITDGAIASVLQERPTLTIINTRIWY